MTWVVFASSALLAWCYVARPGDRLGRHVLAGAASVVGSIVLGLIAQGFASSASYLELRVVFLAIWLPAVVALVRQGNGNVRHSSETPSTEGKGRVSTATPATPTTRIGVARGHIRQ